MAEIKILVPGYTSADTGGAEPGKSLAVGRLHYSRARSNV